ncbi:MAG: TRAP transporter small permease subunit [Burkholderiales bacterium]|nr:TRAP transporter small permease subunit [Burkholderiales bacterium]
MHVLRRFSDILNYAVIAACVACLLAMLAISFIGFFAMAITGEALSWTYSLARLFVPWIGMLSITVAFKAGEHVAMNMLLRIVPAPVAHGLQMLSLAVLGVFAAMLVWYGWDFFIESSQYYMVSDQFQVHHRWVSACVPITGLVLLFHLACGRALLEPPHLDLSTDDAVPPEASR